MADDVETGDVFTIEKRHRLTVETGLSEIGPLNASRPNPPKTRVPIAAHRLKSAADDNDQSQRRINERDAVCPAHHRGVIQIIVYELTRGITSPNDRVRSLVNHCRSQIADDDRPLIFFGVCFFGAYFGRTFYVANPIRGDCIQLVEVGFFSPPKIDRPISRVPPCSCPAGYVFSVVAAG